ncbi:MAG: 2-iminoacetate synthase ThiH [Clostridium sp.]|uniref:2-iminoacetate synthase ThiH n=1 Tax=Clostridium sp. TaxID=1506 RepID=UPI0025BA3260|nr:2-iminoacetate synthase ThiH [Clostridium sp.]MCH3963161.1 2-iminoacetate synthase ThiH [Clostridium sp.]MCI1716376.1 2-iminoacetate synthase ThiH [Clostridium sp.]MCI1800716.1 2-iminoacetate synthase ThiH [Clostridium sp.]MCI1814629.1 2-iminoacetate synthase ThiH [Clostridium sp.]MCI1871539.1 2-iminoacetate synthase ThiH [Clostridium sp.]
MGIYEEIKKYEDFDFDGFFENVTDSKVENILLKDRISREDFLALLSPAAERYLEPMARKAREISIRNFGKSIVLYTPMYIANYCTNKCIYCGYNVENKIVRKKMTYEEIEREAKAISQTGLKHIILLTGESRYHCPMEYLKEAVKILKKYFASICLEIYPLEEDEYRELVELGADSLTVYQETYNEDVYKTVHLAGKKRDYRYRLEALDRGCRAGIHSVGMSALLGLYKWRNEVFLTGVHAEYISKNYPSVEISMSVPRIRPHAGSPIKIYEVTDKNLVQAAMAYKIFLQRAGINITTREGAEMRNNLIPLGVTKMSAGVTTEVGGHSLDDEDKGEGQFIISDSRSVDEIKDEIEKQGYNAVFKDWQYC